MEGGEGEAGRMGQDRETGKTPQAMSERMLTPRQAVGKGEGRFAEVPLSSLDALANFKWHSRLFYHMRDTLIPHIRT